MVCSTPEYNKTDLALRRSEMMGSTFGGIELAKRSLFTQQAALQTTGHNIANANTQGYSRQVVNMVASKPMEAVGLMRSTIPGQTGQGVEFSSVDRIREKFLDSQYQNENKSLGSWEVRKDTMDKLEAITNEPSSTGISGVVSAFWNSWQELSKTPENTTARVLVKQNALALTDAVNQTGKELDNLSSDLTNNIDVNIKEANSITGQISALNGQIFRVEGLGDNANDLRDQRDLLVDNLSKIVNISTTEGSSGYSVNMGNVNLVQGTAVTTTLTTDSVNASFASGDLNGGTINGMIQSRDTDVADYKFQLDSMMKVLATGDMNVTLPQGMVVPEGTTLNGVTYSGSIADRTLSADLPVTVKGLNGLHELGYSGTPGAVKSGVPFFTIKPGFTDFNANSITVNPDIVSDAANVSTSTRTTLDANGVEQVVQGNNDMALMISDLRNNKVSFDPNATGRPSLTNGTFDDFYRSIVGALGVKSEEATRQATNQKALVDQVDSNRQAVSGVSLDEEMANMIKYQHAYNAAARVLTTFDSILDKLINGTGVTR
jgi:flagellar hook-associated protein 1 FlgK